MYLAYTQTFSLQFPLTNCIWNAFGFSYIAQSCITWKYLLHFQEFYISLIIREKQKKVEFSRYLSITVHTPHVFKITLLHKCKSNPRSTILNEMEQAGGLHKKEPMREFSILQKLPIFYRHSLTPAHWLNHWFVTKQCKGKKS